MSTFISEFNLADLDSNSIFLEALHLDYRHQESHNFTCLADETWVCNSCSYINPDSSKTCEMCGSSKE